MLTGSKCAYDACVTFRLPEDLQALSDISLVRDAVKHMGVSDINWIDSRSSPADGLAKPSAGPRKSSGQLTKCLASGRIDAPAKEYTTKDAMEHKNEPEGGPVSESP